LAGRGALLAVGTPIPGARHDAHAWAASGLAETLDGVHVLADLGYPGTGALTGTRTPPGGELSADRAEVDQAVPGIRAVVEHAISHLKSWKILSGRCRAPIHKYESIVRAVTALHFYKFNWCL
jgi:DDE superfamily endonuclease